MALTKTIQAVFEGSPVVSSYQVVAAEVTTLLTEMSDGHLAQWVVGAGAVGAPGCSFSGDLNTGFWAPSADTVAGAAGGAEPWRFTASLWTFAVPAKLPSYTVAGLPSAATAGAGAMAYVTDSNTATFNATVAGGGANKIKVTSDGTNWKVG